jgi:hypothetical protein
MCAAAVIWPLEAAGQPVDTRPAQGPPTPLAANSATPAVVAEEPAAGGKIKASVQERSLGALDGPPLGLLDSTNGGLGADIWQDARRERIEEMLKRLPLASPASSVRDLARRLVLTTADAPEGDAPHSFLSVRLRVLLDAGRIDDAGGLAAKATPQNDPELARLVADAILFSGRSKDACGPATNARLQSSDRFWIELRAFCYAAAGDTDARDLTRAVLAAQKVDSRGFETLLDDYQTHRVLSPQRISEPTSLDVFLLQTVGLPVDPGWSEHLGMPASVVAMRDAKDPPVQRLGAAENIAPAGAAGAADLAVVADAQAFMADQIANAGAVASTLPFIEGQALIRQAARYTPDASEKKRLLIEAMALAYGKNLLPLAAQLQGSAASAVIPVTADRERAPLMTSALMLSGRADAAARWYDLLDMNSDADKLLIHLLQVELNLVAPNPARGFEAQGALTWFAAQAALPHSPGGEDTKADAMLSLGVYDALGLDIPSGAREALVQLQSEPRQGREPAADVLKRLAAGESDGGQRGEAVLSMLDFIGAEGPGDVAPDAIVNFVRALAKMGYPDAARELAVDAFLLHRTAPAVSQSSAS